MFYSMCNNTISFQMEFSGRAPGEPVDIGYTMDHPVSFLVMALVLKE